MKRTILLLLLGVSVGLLAACQRAAAAQPKAEFTIEMAEFSYSPDTIEVQVGQEVTLHLVNLGALEHELMIGRDVVMHENTPSGYTSDFFHGSTPMVMMSGQKDEHSDEHGGEHGDSHSGFMVDLPGNSDNQATVTFTVTEDMLGEWEIGCFEDGGSHYTAGMVGKLVVKP